ncbi:HNH endonuclease [Clostridium paraputrificum]|uniref:HNH endonuclease n=1 Tax=Clostridium TaxID=1485 RepID=UPI00232E3E53|nr:MULTISPECIES: HNH endonuclease [Clostridium]MDB2089370.1 HNH endonuclease [Clostridium paraputrificum]MDB2097729.1 HNH endonuclease [Clostridium paraputrificum]MDU1180023.1 HNH endonuclease [Clostridium sp.]MDU1228078.1 HNH endonuclease [Clostridium sp.]MDU7654018.1 HNH endonuclease [Clostridium sp.]
MRSNIYVINDDYAQMIIESQKYGIKRVKIDIEDIDKCKKYQWHYANSKDVPYIATRINGKYIRLHRYIYENVDDGLVVDHINRNPLDNRKSNLRCATPQENGFNKSVRKDNKTGVIGVEYLPKRNIWRGKIKYNNNTIHLGYFNDFNKAVIARRIAEEYLFGQFSPNKTIYNIEVNFKEEIIKRIIDKIA